MARLSWWYPSLGIIDVIIFIYYLFVCLSVYLLIYKNFLLEFFNPLMWRSSMLWFSFWVIECLMTFSLEFWSVLTKERTYANLVTKNLSFKTLWSTSVTSTKSFESPRLLGRLWWSRESGRLFCNQSVNRLQFYSGDCDPPSRLDRAASYQKSVNSGRLSQSSGHFLGGLGWSRQSFTNLVVWVVWRQRCFYKNVSIVWTRLEWSWVIIRKTGLTTKQFLFQKNQS